MEVVVSASVIARVAHYMSRVHGLAQMTVEPLSLADVCATYPDSSANTIAGTYLHLATGYERMVSLELKQGPSIFDREGWNQKLGLTFPADINDPIFRTLNDSQWQLVREYVGSVFAEVEAYVGGLNESAAAAPIASDMFGSATVLDLLIWPMLFHTSHHFGEISALIGLRNKAGLPF